MSLDALPKETFWNNQATPLTIVNKDDLRLPHLFKRIGATSLVAINMVATSDRDEIIRRQELADWLLQNNAVKAILAEYSFKPGIHFSADSFMFEFNPERQTSSLFMERLRLLSEVIEKSLKQKTPAVVRRFAKILRETLDGAEATEREFRTVAYDYLSRAAQLSGTVDYVRNANRDGAVVSREAVVSGYRLYCYEPLEYRRWEYSDADQEWADYHPILSAPKRVAMALWNRRFDRIVYGQQVIDTLPDELKSIVYRAGQEILAKDDMSSQADWRLTFAFRYMNGELRLKLIDMDVDFTDERGNLHYNVDRQPRVEALEHKLLTSFRGYSWWHKRWLIRQNKLIDRRSVRDHLQRVHKAFIHTNLPKSAEEYFSDKGKLIEDRKFSEKFGMYALKGLCLEEDELPVKPLYQRVSAYRDWTAARVHQLKELAQVLQTMQATATAGALPFEFPDVLETHEHLIRFDSIMPTHLIGQVTAKGDALQAMDLRPIKGLSKLNGKVVFLTGHNAGGKTVTQESLAEMVYLAQCGLPVFGENISFNPKEVMAVVFIERGAGSTAELLLRKIKATLEVVTKSDPARTLVVLDELGTGTQEMDGDQLARQVLARLHQIGCSVLCSTQIMSLAQHAEKELGALMFQVDRTRTIAPGIGRGDVVGLADRVGLTEYLH